VLHVAITAVAAGSSGRLNVTPVPYSARYGTHGNSADDAGPCGHRYSEVRQQ